MRKTVFAALVFIQLGLAFALVAQETPDLKVQVSIAPEIRSSFLKGGRLIVYLTRQKIKEPRRDFDVVFGVTPERWDASSEFVLDTRNRDVIGAGPVAEFLNDRNPFYCQVLYKQNPDDGQQNVPGNLYSEVDTINFSAGQVIPMKLTKSIPTLEIVKHQFVMPVVIRSQSLSEFSGKDRFLKASVLLPSSYFANPGKSFPICYRIPGLNGRYDGVNNLLRNKDLADWWFSGNAPQVIYVFMDSQGPYGDTYLVDSENNGPCGKALTEELIPEIEKLVHYQPNSGKRYLAGCSTGGWVALGLQIFYPDFFNGTWSYSPDPVDFEHFGLIDIYHDETVFYNRYGYLQPESRTIYGDMKSTMKETIAEENVFGRNGNYRSSGGQFGAYNAVFGPKGADGLPTLMFDPMSGKIDHAIAAKWEKYDLKKVLEKNWTTLGPKLQGKIWIWTGDMDGLFSNVATRFLKMFLDKTENPTSDAKISFTPMAGHCQEWSDKAVITMVAEKAAGK